MIAKETQNKKQATPARSSITSFLLTIIIYHSTYHVNLQFFYNVFPFRNHNRQALKKEILPPIRYSLISNLYVRFGDVFLYSFIYIFLLYIYLFFYFILRY